MRDPLRGQKYFAWTEGVSHKELIRTIIYLYDFQMYHLQKEKETKVEVDQHLREKMSKKNCV